MEKIKRDPVQESAQAKALAHAYGQLQQHFVAGLPKRQAEILQAQNDVEKHAALHRLAGAAGSFGFPALSGLARQAMHDQNDQESNLLTVDKHAEKSDALEKIGCEIDRLTGKNETEYKPQ